ncbi:MAG: hypothetical protein H6690_01955 [Erysipelotrichaceae bacterium]|jgi:hypothetical protein|nr:hypothetical protein [Erysipelotrichaceae bacterium]
MKPYLRTLIGSVSAVAVICLGVLSYSLIFQRTQNLSSLIEKSDEMDSYTIKYQNNETSAVSQLSYTVDKLNFMKLFNNTNFKNTFDTSSSSINEEILITYDTHSLVFSKKYYYYIVDGKNKEISPIVIETADFNNLTYCFK